jgi:site-specific recombinase XerD
VAARGAKTKQDSPSGAAFGRRPVLSEVAAVLEELASSGEVSDLRIENYVFEFETFGKHLAEIHCVEHLRDVSPDHAKAFVTYPKVSEGRVVPSSVKTHRTRRSNLKLMYKLARRLDLADTDPTLDVQLPPSPGRSTRPLTDAEIALGRSFSMSSLRENRWPTAWALAQTTATTSESGWLKVSDVDQRRRGIWIHGTNRRQHRFVLMTEWGAEQIARRLRHLRSSPLSDPPLLLAHDRGSLSDRTCSATEAISNVLTRAGLRDDHTVRPSSVVSWRGAHELANGASIAHVAKLLGVRTLDSAAAIIGYDWRAGSED